MASTAPTSLRGRLGFLLAGSRVVTALTAATAAAAAPTPTGGHAPAMTPLGAGSPAPGFLLERGRYTPLAIPPHLAATAPQGIVPTGSATAARSWASTSTTA